MLEALAGTPMKRHSTERWLGPTLSIVLLLSTAPALWGAVPDSSSCPRLSGVRGPCGYAGRPLVEALEDLRTRGLNLIFSSDLVRPDMMVETEPPVAAPRQVLGRLLSAFGLEARDGPAGTILIVRAAVSGHGGAGEADQPVPSIPALRERLRVGASPRGEPEPVTTLGREDLERLPTVGDDTSRKMAWLPGIASADRSAQFSIRGGEPNEALVILDGLAIDEPFHLKDFFAFSSIVDARAIDRVDVLTGTFPAEYGDRASGVIDLSTAGPSDGGRTAFGLSLVNASVLSEGRLGDGGGSWLVSARSWRPDAVIDTVELGGDGINPSYNDLLGKVQVRLPGGSILSAHLLASQDALRYRTERGDGSVGAGDDHRYAWVNVKTPWTERLYSQTLISSDRIGRNRHGTTSDTVEEFTRVDDARSFGSTALKQDWILTAGERSSLKWGFDARRFEAQYIYRSHVERTDPFAGAAAVSVTDRNLILDPSGSEIGAYVAGRFRVLPPLTLEIGVRRDRQSLTGEAETSPRANLVWSLGERTLLRAGWGRFHQPQGVNELQIEDGVTDFFPAQRAEHRQIDLEHLFPDGTRLGVSAYIKDMTHLRPRYENLFNPFQLFPESEWDRVRIAPERARLRGIEIELSGDRRRALGWRASYALASAEDEVEGAWVPRSWDQRHALNVGLDYRRGETWEVSLAVSYHTGWPTTDVRAEQVQNPDGSFAVRPILGPRNGLRYPAYHRLDLRVTRRFRLRGGTLALYLDVTNLYGHNNVCCVDDFQYLPRADGGVRVDRTEGFWLRQLPVAGLDWDF